MLTRRQPRLQPGPRRRPVVPLAMHGSDRLALALFAVLLLGTLQGCAQLVSRPAPQWQQVLPAQWQNVGKIAINIPAPDAASATSNHVLRYAWQQNGEDYSVRLSGAFGLGAVTVERHGERVYLLRGGEVIEQASSSEQLFYRHTGLQLPVSHLRYWITGVADASTMRSNGRNSDSSNSDSGEQAVPALASFEHSGWQVSFPKAVVQQGITLPRKIIARGPEAAVTVAIARWHLGQP